MEVDPQWKRGIRIQSENKNQTVSLNENDETILKPMSWRHVDNSYRKRQSTQLYLVLNIGQIEIENILFLESKKNIILKNSKFTKIIYSDVHMILNSLYVEVGERIKIEERSGNVFYLENRILCHYNECHNIQKNKTFSFIHGLKMYMNEINTSTSTSTSTILKISGVWETETNIGLTFKFLSE